MMNCCVEGSGDTIPHHQTALHYSSSWCWIFFWCARRGQSRVGGKWRSWFECLSLGEGRPPGHKHRRLPLQSRRSRATSVSSVSCLWSPLPIAPRAFASPQQTWSCCCFGFCLWIWAVCSQGWLVSAGNGFPFLGGNMGWFWGVWGCLYKSLFMMLWTAIPPCVYIYVWRSEFSRLKSFVAFEFCVVFWWLFVLEETFFF